MPEPAGCIDTSLTVAHDDATRSCLAAAAASCSSWDTAAAARSSCWMPATHAHVLALRVAASGLLAVEFIGEFYDSIQMEADGNYT